MTDNPSDYSSEERARLLNVAREALTAAATGRVFEILDLQTFPPALRELRACFVTLREGNGDLRGCTGTLVARQSLVQEVGHTTVQTALHDPRFPPLCEAEVPDLHIEISILTPPVERQFQSSKDIPALLQPYVDGVILVVDGQRATFLPQVWERMSDPVDFLNLLCRKMGLPPQSWTRKDVQLYTYEAIVIEE